MSGKQLFEDARGFARAVSAVVVLTVLLAFGGSRIALADDNGGSSGGGGSNSGSGSGSGGSGGGGKDDSGGSSSGSGSQNSGSGGSQSSGGGSGSGQNRMESGSHEMFENFGARLQVSVDTRDDRVRFKAEVENLNLPAGTTVNVCVQGQSVGTVALDALHGAELQLESRGGANTLAVSANSLVEVKVGGCGSGVPAILATRVGGAATAAAQPRRVEDRSRSAFQSFGAELQVEVENERDRNRFRVEVEDVNLTPGALLNVCLRGEHLGRITLDDFHSGELEFDSRRNSSVPSVSVGDLVEVREGACSNSGMSALALRVGRGGVPTNNGSAPMARLNGASSVFFGGFAAEFNIGFEVVGNRKRFRAQVGNLNLPSGTSLNVCRQGQLLGTLTLNQFHAGELELNSRDGMAVPAVAAGDVIGVRQGGCGSTAASIVETTVR